MTVDRLIVVRFPMAAPRLCTTRRAVITIACTGIAVFGLNIYVLFSYKLQNEGTGKSNTLLLMNTIYAFKNSF
jgi:hypothetical protein